MKKVKVIELYKTIKKSSRGNAILFFTFYFFFFLFLIIFLSGKKGNYHRGQYESGNQSFFSLNELFDKNYEFSYEIELDNNNYLYSGKRYNDRELFTYQDKEYYREGESFYVKEDVWNKVENPNLFYKFFNEDNIGNLLTASSYASHTNYESGKNTYNYLLSSNTINQFLNNISSDFFEEPNQVVVHVNENGIVDEIDYYLDSYCQLNNLCEKSLSLKLSFSNYGSVQVIEKPVLGEIYGR